MFAFIVLAEMVRGRGGDWEGMLLRGFQSRFEICVALFQSVDFLLHGLVFAGLFFVFGH